MDCVGCGKYSGSFSTCDECEEAFDIWESKSAEREQAAREKLDSQGYYDDPEKWELEYGTLHRHRSNQRTVEA